MPSGVYVRTEAMHNHKGHEVSEETREAVRKAQLGRKHSEERCRKNGDVRRGKKQSTLTCKRKSEVLMGKKRSEFSERHCKSISNARKKEIAEGNANLNGIAPFGLENLPLERVLDLLLLVTFVGSASWNFRKDFTPPDNHSLRYQIDFVCRLLRIAIESDELYHDDNEVVAYDERRDKFFVETRDFDIVYRGCKQLRAETDLVNIVKEIYDLCNQQREKYQLWYLPVLKFDDRWVTYLEKMQELLREHRLSKGSKKLRFKIFREKKRETDRQHLCLLEDLARDQSSNFVDLVRESLETDHSIKQKNIVSLWRSK